MIKIVRKACVIFLLLIDCALLVSCGIRDGEKLGTDDGTVESRAGETGAKENGAADNGAMDNGPVENGPTENGSMKNGSVETDSQENGPMKNGSIENHSIESRSIENGSMKITEGPEGQSSSDGPILSDNLQKISTGIDEYMSRYRAAGAAYDPPTDTFISTIAVETRGLMDLSAEGGTITRYEDANQKLLRYRLMFYGETGRSESNYYFADSFTYYTELAEEYCTPITLTAADTDILQRTLSEGIIIDDTCYRYDHRNDQILERDLIVSVYTQKELDQLFAEADEIPDDTAAINDKQPVTNVSSAEALEIYRGLLADESMYFLTRGDSKAIYAFGDCNGDGLPELHLAGGYDYRIYTCRNGKAALLRRFDLYNTPLTPLKDGGMIGYKAQGSISDHYYYRKLDYDGSYIDSESRDFYVEFSAERDPDQDTYTINHVSCTRKEWEEAIAPYRDMWENPALSLSWERVFPEEEWEWLDQREN